MIIKSKNTKITHFRTWKSGKHWIYAASALTALILGGLGAQSVLADTATAVQTGTNNSLGAAVDSTSAAVSQTAPTVPIITTTNTTLVQGTDWSPVSNFSTATDSEGQNVAFTQLVVTGAVDTNTAGTYMVQYSYTDPVTNLTALSTATVTVLAAENSLSSDSTENTATNTEATTATSTAPAISSDVNNASTGSSTSSNTATPNSSDTTSVITNSSSETVASQENTASTSSTNSPISSDGFTEQLQNEISNGQTAIANYQTTAAQENQIAQSD